MRTIIYIIFLIVLVFSCPGSSQTFCAVGYYGEFTQIDPLIGEVGVKRTDLPKQLQTMSWSPNGTLYAGTNGGQVYSINPLSGDYTLAYQLPVNDLRSMTFSSSGLLYINHLSSDGTIGYLKTINFTTGEILTVGTMTVSSSSKSILQGLEFSPAGILYGITPHRYQNTYGLYTVNTTNAAVHLIAGFSNTANINQSLTFTNDGNLYAIGSGAFAQINPINGTIIGLPVTLYGDYRGLAVVPEPVACFYLALGAFYMMKKRKS